MGFNGLTGPAPNERSWLNGCQAGPAGAAAATVQRRRRRQQRGVAAAATGNCCSCRSALPDNPPAQLRLTGGPGRPGLLLAAAVLAAAEYPLQHWRGCMSAARAATRARSEGRERQRDRPGVSLCGEAQSRSRELQMAYGEEDDTTKVLDQLLPRRAAPAAATRRCSTMAAANSSAVAQGKQTFKTDSRKEFNWEPRETIQVQQGHQSLSSGAAGSPLGALQRRQLWLHRVPDEQEEDGEGDPQRRSSVVRHAQQLAAAAAGAAAYKGTTPSGRPPPPPNSQPTCSSRRPPSCLTSP